MSEKDIERAAEEMAHEACLIHYQLPDGVEATCPGAGEKQWKAGFIAGAAYAQRWIPVSERLPEASEHVLCTSAEHPHPNRWIDWIRTEAQGGGWNWSIHATHWMPLPAPPQEKV